METDDDDRTPLKRKTRSDYRPDSRRHGRLPMEFRPFTVWDGEGYNVFIASLSEVARVHCYCLFGSSRDDYITSRDLSTLECLNLLVQSKQDHPDDINVAFAFEYDVNMILKDLRFYHLKKLKVNGYVWWNGWRIEHIPRKWFQCSRRIGGVRIAIRIFDVFTFFNTSLVNALNQYVPNCNGFDRIKAGKERRSQFSYQDLATEILPYWRLENAAAVEMMNAFRENLWGAGLKISSWHGPGSLANYLFKQHDIKKVMNSEEDKSIILASRYAFAGGRFEQFRGGLFLGSIFSYDINSAYPYIISKLPNMSTGNWRYTNSISTIKESRARVGLVRLQFRADISQTMRAVREALPLPFFSREHTGCVSYPPLVDNWYFIQEARLGLSLRGIRVREAWLYEDDGTYPFDWVAEAYAQRKIWKGEGNPSQLSLKLGLNSLFGKMAQRVGWNKTTGKPPTWHQLDWAGTITASTRASLYPAMLEAASKNGLISVETDGIYTTCELEVLANRLGSDLGQFELTEYEGMLIIQNGLYWLKKDGKWLQPKSRGIPQTELSFDRAKAALQDGYPLRAKHNTFMGYGISVAHPGSLRNWRTWKERPREFTFGGTGKRHHVPKHCKACSKGITLAEGFHTLAINRIDGRHSYPHPLPWLNEPNLVSEDMLDEREYSDVDM